MNEAWRTILYQVAPRSRSAGFKSLLVTVDTALEWNGYPENTLKGLFAEAGKKLKKSGGTVGRAVSREIQVIWELGDRELLMKFLNKRFQRQPTAGELIDALLFRLSGEKAGW